MLSDGAASALLWASDLTGHLEVGGKEKLQPWNQSAGGEDVSIRPPPAAAALISFWAAGLRLCAAFVFIRQRPHGNEQQKDKSDIICGVTGSP